MNFLWIDVETTGLDANKNDIIQLACVPVINGVQQKPFNEFCQPLNWDAIDDGAIATHGITVERMKTFQQQSKLLEKFIDYLSSFGVRFTIAGFNVPFDKGFLSSAFAKNGLASQFFQLFTLDIHDTLKRAKSVRMQLQMTSVKLSALAIRFNIPLDAHDALSDILATIEVDKRIGAVLGESENDYISESVTSIEAKLPLVEPAQLHVHSMYGMVDSMPTVKQWEDWCEKNGVPGFSVVDHGSAISLFDAIRTKKVPAIPGTGIYLQLDDEQEYHPLNIWAISDVGYFNVMRLASLGFENTQQDKETALTIPVLTLRQVLDHREGIKFGLPCLDNAVAKKLFSAEGKDAAEDKLKQYVASFGDDLYVELCPVDVNTMFVSNIGFQPVSKSGITPDGNLQKAYNKFLAEMIDKYELRAVPVSNAHFIEASDKVVQDCVSKNSCKNSRYYKESYHARTAGDMFAGLKRHLGDWMTEEKFNRFAENTLEILRDAKNIKIEFDHHLPKVEIPQHIRSKTDDYDTQTYYYMLERIKQHGRWRNDPVYVERFTKELDVIMKNETLNFIPYFLMYDDISAFARSQGILQNIARGSAGGSLISYYLKIIHVDPIKAELPFERFLSHARIRAGSFPDIDLDIGKTARPLVMRYLKEKYGAGFAQVATFNTVKTKNAIKDVMYALYGKNRNDLEVASVCESIPDSPAGVDEMKFLYGYVDQEGIEHKGQIDVNQHLKNFFTNHPEVEDLVKRMLGLVRGWSRHASAFVISTIDLSSSRIPTLIMNDSHVGKILVTQYDASMVEKSNLVKADILGVKTLSSVSECVELVKKNRGIDLLEEDSNGVALIYRLPEDDRVYKDFYDKDTDSSFQFNTELIKGYIQQFNPTERKHLSAMTALCRPGALDAEWEPGVSAAQYYMDVRNGVKAMEFVHDDLRPILGNSNGVFVYQEEIMRFLVEIAGYTPEDSDQIRNAIAKKKHEVMMAAFERIRAGTKKRGWTEEQTERVNNHIMAFSRYSFNKSHSHAYAELGYITMYLKHHFKLEWWTAVLNNEDKEDKMRKYVSYLGNIVAPPSLRRPAGKFTVMDDRIRAPLTVVKGVGASTVDELVKKGPFENLHDFIERVNHAKANIGNIGALIQARAADDMMSQDIPYPDARKQFMEEYVRIRKARSNFKPELQNLSPVNIFLQERNTNQCFNKHLISDPYVAQMVLEKYPKFKVTGLKEIPFLFKREVDDSVVYVLDSVSSAERLLKNDKEDQEVGIVGLFESSRYRTGTSKRGKEWHLVAVQFSDGYSSMELTIWDRHKALNLPVNSVIFVKGKLKEGWKYPVSLVATDDVEVLFK